MHPLQVGVHAEGLVMAAAAALALHRFGLGPRRGDLAAIGNDPRGALWAELERPDAARLDGNGLLDTVAILTERRREADLAKQGLKATADASPAMSDAGAAMADGDAPMKDSGPTTAPAPAAVEPVGRRVVQAEIAARIERALAAETGIVERLVAFWTNHFAVEADASSTVRYTAGAFEREAIRPYVLGRFEDMLLAVTKHPAMLAYLDTVRSVGPNSTIGEKLNRGFNENHARELLELHTVGVDAGYSQADVTAFAQVLTGWTYSRGKTGEWGRFLFRGNAHEPGARMVMGVSYPQAGIDQGEAVLHDLARHPATARHIGQKLARHFVADDPPPQLSERLSATFLDTGGDLKACAETLIGSDEAWGPPAKLKLPQEFLWSALRALGLSIEARLAARAMAALGQPFWNPPSPEGFPDDAPTWLAADAVTDRLDFAEELAARADPEIDPSALLVAVLGSEASPATREAIARAESRTQALALLLMSPEFQRR
jgi:uncharacterized protein (DUF1800 family)